MKNKLPVIFHPRYDISLLGIENLHPFDSKKYGGVFNILKEKGILTNDNYYQPFRIDDEELKKVHSELYIRSLKSSRNVARIAELPLLRKLPNFLLQWRFLDPMRYATAGTVMGMALAVKYGWAINLSGGYHHAEEKRSSGFCFFSDISLAVYKYHAAKPDAKVLVIDLDAHQGNGFERILGEDPRVDIFDVYNGYIYPMDLPAREFIDYNFPVRKGMKDKEYLELLNKHLPGAIDRSKPEIIIYNAGTDIFEEDPLGGFSVTKKGIIERDEMVFGEALKRKIPVLMVLSGGYTFNTREIISDSIENLIGKFKLK